LPPKVTKYRYDAASNPNGRGEFLMMLPESGTQSDPRIATYTDADLWAQTYDVTIPLVIDPEYTFEQMMVQDQPAWPFNMLVDCRTMTLVDYMSGSPDSAFWNKYDDVLAGTY
jgi:hypothetical protein